MLIHKLYLNIHLNCKFTSLLFCFLNSSKLNILRVSSDTVSFCLYDVAA